MMINGERRLLGIRTLVFGLTCALFLWTGGSAFAQRLTGTENGEWRYLGGDAGHTRSSPLDQINGDNFSDLEVAWICRGDNYSPNRDYFMRATPLYVDGVLYTVAGVRRQVVAIDPATGETLWIFREPETVRFLRSPRRAYGKGVAYAEVDGRGGFCQGSLYRVACGIECHPKVAIHRGEVKADRTVLSVAKLVLFADAGWVVLPIRWRRS